LSTPTTPALATPARICPQCGSEVQKHWLVCPACAAALQTDTLTVKTRHGMVPLPSSPSAEEGRFPAGTVLAGRYRVLGLVGVGGMGEVYRAQDLILNQPVALKFLPQAKMSEAALARFRNEVRIARQVSHPNVCRVYDIGFVEGQQFLSMEYLDGEDLASLLRRIGRLPQDKAIEFARKICAGLAAAHERGVLHRDLKPSNVMIDGRGQVRITDFGLAAVASEIPLGDVRSGTPAYMSPEQKAGKEVTTRSDFYSLGLVLFEMFTGKRRGDSSSGPSEVVKDLDPAVDRVIQRCLEEDPKRRPSSALNIALALPGGDPIAAALAAGETPSPEMVAASQEKEGFQPRTAWLCFVSVLALLAAISLLDAKLGLPARAPLETPPDGLAFRARTILEQFGYTNKPADTAYGFNCCDMGYLESLAGTEVSRRNALLATNQPAVIWFWYREHGQTLHADSFMLASALPPLTPLNGAVTYGSPANTEPGMIRLLLGPNGDLRELEVRPSGAPTDAAPQPMDWKPVFAAAGLEPERFTPASPEQLPQVPFDERAAWTGAIAEGRTEQIRIEAASWQGRPVSFTLRGDWQPKDEPATTIPAYALTLMVGAGVVLLGAGAVLAYRNLRLGRGDKRGAAWAAGATFVLNVLSWVLTAHHVPDTWQLILSVKALCFATYLAVVLATLYLAIEPYARRFWPDALISLTRLQAGRLRDPLVASHVLGSLAVTWATTAATLGVLGAVSGDDQISITRLDMLGSPSYAVGLLLFDVGRALGGTLATLVLLILLRLLARRQWLADLLAAVAVTGVLYGVQAWANPSPLVVPLTLLSMGAKLVMLRYWGVLALTVSVLTEFFRQSPLAATSWYAGQSVLLLSIPAVVALWALWAILTAARPAPSETAA
jgi:serine/threonine-protein kinase